MSNATATQTPDRTIAAWGLFPGELFAVKGVTYEVKRVRGGYTLADERKPRDRRFRRISAVNATTGAVRNFRKPLDEQIEVVWLKTDD